MTAQEGCIHFAASLEGDIIKLHAGCLCKARDQQGVGTAHVGPAKLDALGFGLGRRNQIFQVLVRSIVLDDHCHLVKGQDGDLGKVLVENGLFP